MTIGRIVVTSVACLILAVIAGFATRNIIIGILFPILLVAFLLMWNNLRNNSKELNKVEEVTKEEDISLDVTSEAPVQPAQPIEETQQTQPPVSTYFPPRRPQV